MQDMLKKIIEIDEKARKIKEEAQQEKALTESEIADIKQKIHDDYINRAKIRVETNLNADREEAEQNLIKAKAKHEEIIKTLQSQYAENHEKWSDEIFKRTIS